MTNKRFEYLALSHMWGDPSVEHIKLELSDVATFESNIPWHRLSSIYKEAIRVTCALGYQYLWIDSLCIIQDSKSDWEYEARLMATVYGNAACNLAFLFPFVSDETTKRSDPRDWNPCILRAATPSEPGAYIQHHTSRLRAAYQSTAYQSTETPDWLIQREWPLFTRAWTFQEYLLSPRTLLLGHKNLMWQCNAGFYDELLGPIAAAPRKPSNTTPKRGRDMGKSRYFPPNLLPGFGEDVVMSAPASLSFMIDWQALLDEYHKRNLTQAEDRVIAFAGIACAFQNMGNLTYLAGAWAEFFPLCALWYVNRKSSATVWFEGPVVHPGETVTYPIAVHEAVVQNAPSWSQFSVPIYTHHQTFFIFNDDEVFVRSKSFEVVPRVYWNDIHWALLESFKFGEHAVGHFPESAYFDFGGLEATLNIPILPVRTSFPADLEKHFQRIRNTDPLDSELQWIPDFTYHPDAPSESGKGASPPRHSILALIAEFQICRVAGKYTIQRRLAGLVLVREEREGTWRRVGAWKLKIKIFDIHVSEDNIKDVAERWNKYRMWTIGETWKMEKVTLL
jgi:hypothetical protein